MSGSCLWSETSQRPPASGMWPPGVCAVRLAARRPGGLPTAPERAYAGVLWRAPAPHARSTSRRCSSGCSSSRRPSARRRRSIGGASSRGAPTRSPSSSRSWRSRASTRSSTASAASARPRWRPSSQSCSRPAACSSRARPATRATTSRRSGGRRSARSRCTPRDAAIGFSAAPTDVMTSATVALGDGSVTPHAVSRALEALGQPRPLAVFLDEFDRLSSAGCRALFTDTIKLLSDRAVPATLVLDRRRRHGRRADPRAPLGRARTGPGADAAHGARRAGRDRPPGHRVGADDDPEARRRPRDGDLTGPAPLHASADPAGRAGGARRAARGCRRAREVDFAVERAIQRAQQSVTEAYLRAETVGAVAAGRGARGGRRVRVLRRVRRRRPPRAGRRDAQTETSCPPRSTDSRTSSGSCRHARRRTAAATASRIRCSRRTSSCAAWPTAW